MKGLTTIEKLTLVFGSLGVALNTIAVLSGFAAFGYIAIFLGRVAAFTYSVALDRFRWYYLIPLFLSAVNAVVQSEFGIFIEVLSQSIIYQVIAYRVFQDKLRLRSLKSKA